MAEDELAHRATEEWKSDLARLIRRREIYDRIHNGGRESLAEIRHQVRDYEDKIGVEAIIDSLIKNTTDVSPEIRELATLSVERIRDKHDEFAGLVILGSEAHGGAKVKKKGSRDFDSGGLFTSQVTPEIKADTLNIMNSIASGTGINPCIFLNPSKINTQVLSNSADGLTVAQRLGDPSSKSTDGQYRAKVLLYFEPSFPEVVNHDNRRFLLNGLENLSLENHDAWENAVANIYEGWKNIHRLKHKHVKWDGWGAKDEEIADRVIEGSSEVMSQVMIAALIATDKSSQNM